ncbi:hypothetical protein DFH08DRAFT_977103 [Mycena albidolilacea]|uniref:Uncharacterized protein n=1 Tax=Mycena albidolilacea TaxID=1033008 RepID=A0AAD6Z1Q7_9AGAR|nr:hypothetical protein DFH08DRAFT_977103 [Mycena albidolilacea]
MAHLLAYQRAHPEYLENHLNRVYGAGTPYYKDFSTFNHTGVAKGWGAQTEINGCTYRQGRIIEPSAVTCPFSTTTVYMDYQQFPEF